MSERMTDKQTILNALDDAIQWQTEFRSANLGFDQEQVLDAEKRIAAYRRVLGRITGGQATVREIVDMFALRGTKPLSIQEIRRKIETGEIKPTIIREGGE